MKKARYTGFINDNYLYMLDNKTNKIFSEHFKYLKEDNIINEQKFYFELNQFIRKNKIKIPIFGHRLNVIINNNLNYLQKNKYLDFFNDYFKSIKFINILDILPFKKNLIFINITEEYIDFYFQKKNENKSIRIYKLIFGDSEFKVISHFLNTIFFSKKIVFFGTSKVIPELTKRITKELGIKCNYQEDYSNYILTEYKNNNNLNLKYTKK